MSCLALSLTDGSLVIISSSNFPFAFLLIDFQSTYIKIYFLLGDYFFLLFANDHFSDINPFVFFADFDISEVQYEHASIIEQLVPSLADLRSRISSHMNDKKFWMIYFILLLPRLNEEDSELLSTLEVRYALHFSNISGKISVNYLS